MGSPGLEFRFETELLDAYESWKREAHFAAGRFKPMVTRHGGVETARRLLAKPGISPGFLKLKEARLLRLSVEYLVLDPGYSTLFTPEECSIARKRLIDNGFRGDRVGMAPPPRYST